MNKSTILQGIKIKKSYQRPQMSALTVLQDIDIDLKSGEFVSIVGNSGVGKSTLIHILGGIDSPDSGKVLLDGHDMFGYNSRQRSAIRAQHIGYVFQAYYLLPECDVLENTLLPARIAGMSSSDMLPKAEGLLTQLGLKDRLSHFPNQLSGGEQQRVAIARALINSPKIVFCDEPTGNLDEQTGRTVFDLLRELQDHEHVSLLLVTHDHDSAKQAHRCLRLHEGRLMPS